MSNTEQDEIQRLKSRIAVLEDLLSVQERTVREQSERLELALTQALIATRAKTELLAAVEQSPASVVITDVRGNIEYVNPKFTELTGYTLEEVLGKNPRILKSGECPAETYEQLWRTITSGGEWRGEFHNKKKNGELYWESALLSPIRNTQGEITHFLAVKEDITDRKRGAEALRASEELFRTAFQNAPFGIFLSALDTRIMQVNDRMCQMLGYSKEEVLARGWPSLTHPDDMDISRRALDQMLRGRVPTTDFEKRYIHKNGNVIWTRVRISLVQDAQGNASHFITQIEDVTNRKRAEETIRESEQKYRSLVSNIPDVSWTVDAKLHFTFISPNIESMTGYTVREVYRHGARIVLDGIHPDDLQRVWKDFEALFTRDQPYDVEFRFRRKNGEWIWVRDRALTTYEKDGRRYADGLLSDITERKRAEDELFQSRQMLQSILDNIPQRVFWKDRNLAFLGCNRAFALDAGLQDPTAIIGKDDFDLPSRDTAELYRADDRRVMEQESAKLNFEEPQSRPDGGLVWLRTNKLPLRDREGRVIGVIGTYEDITERKRAEAENSRLALIVNSSDDSIFSVNRDGLIATWNTGAERMYGYSAEEIKGKNISVLVPEDRQGDLAANRERLYGGEALVHYEFEHMGKDGSRLQVLLTLSPLKGATGVVNGVSVISRDITEQKRVEVELHRAKEIAESANRAKSEFLANMSHEIRTPMNGIIGMTDLALDTPLSSEQREYLTMVKDSADSLLSLINDILDFSKIEAGKLSLDPVKFDLHDALANATRALSVRAGQKKLELACMAEPGVPRGVIGDPGRLRQVIVNLVGNAIKFTEQGEVVLRVAVESRRNEDILLHFTVRDTGIGIPLEKQETIFEAFTQADSSMSRKHEGTGLGLTISLRIVKMMGGQMWVESAPGQGSTFHFTVRMGLSGEVVPESAPREIVNLHDLPVLVVDDNNTNRKILKAMLQHWMMRPTLAASGPEGLAVLEQAVSVATPFPLVLLDAQMPDMDGFDLAERIKQDPSLAGATIMMLTSAGQRGDVQRCRELGIAVYLIKPIRQSELLEAILAALGKAPASGERAAVITRHTLRETRRKLQVLLAEDNPVNQQLVIRLLEKRGHLLTVASDGREALAILKKSRFDLVLMDVQMPGMDGLQATAAIRKEEAGTGKHIPIIAMTAHAMEGDRERCLAAGMDGYVPKPIKVEDLLETIENLGQPREVAQVATTAEPREQEPIDAASALARVEGDVGLLKELVALFLKDLPDMLINIREAVTAGDASAIERTTHKLKGSVGNFAAQPAFEAALKLEVLGRGANLSEAESAYAELEKEIKRLKSAMAKLRGIEVGA